MKKPIWLMLNIDEEKFFVEIYKKKIDWTEWEIQQKIVEVGKIGQMDSFMPQH